MCSLGRWLRVAAALVFVFASWQPALGQASQACGTYFHVARLHDGSMSWDALTPNMRKWWTGKGHARLPGLCYASSPDQADYLIVWQDGTETISESFSVPVPDIWIMAPLYDAVGTGTATEWASRTRTERTVTLALYSARRGEMPQLPSSAVLSTTKTKAWPWSKPDKDGLVEILEALGPHKR